MFEKHFSSARRINAVARTVLTTCLFTLLLCQPLFAAQAPLRIDYPDFWPFFTKDAEGKMTGMFYEIVSEAMDRMEIKTTWETFPWGRCQEHVRNGEATAMITVPTPERATYTNTHATPFYQKRLTVFTYVNHPKMKKIEAIQTIDDILLANLSVITYMSNGWNDKNIRAHGIKTYETPKLINVWLMLSHKRGDIVIEWPGAAWPDIRKAGVNTKVFQTDVSLDAMPFHLLIRKNSLYAKQLPEFDRTIVQMQQDGTIDRIVKKYVESHPGNGQ